MCPVARTKPSSDHWNPLKWCPLLMAWPATAEAILVNGVSALVANHRIRRVAMPYAELGAQASPKITA